MSNDDHWITTLLAEARGHHPSVTETVSARMNQLLKVQLGERPLSSTELTSVAKALIADMAPIPPTAEAEQ